jgi:DNA-binding transcriptional LysR family regulator
MAIELDELHAFAALADSTSVQKAAELSGSAPATLRRRVARLHRWLGPVALDHGAAGPLLNVTGWINARLDQLVAECGGTPPAALRLADLRALVVVEQEGSINRAATRLRVTQPSLTRTMQRLERDVGAGLLVRSPAGTATTRAGQHAIAAIEEIDRRLQGLHHHDAGPGTGPATTGRLRIALDVVAPLELVDRIQAALEGDLLAPSLLRGHESEQLLRAGELDLGVLRMRREPVGSAAGVRTRVVAQQPFRIGVSSRRAPAAATPLSLRQLAGSTWALRPVEHEWHERLWRAHGVRPGRVLLVSDEADIAALVGDGRAVRLVDPLTAPRAGFAVRRLAEHVPSWLVLQWRPGADAVADTVFDAVGAHYAAQVQGDPALVRYLRRHRTCHPDLPV